MKGAGVGYGTGRRVNGGFGAMGEGRAVIDGGGSGGWEPGCYLIPYITRRGSGTRGYSASAGGSTDR